MHRLARHLPRGKAVQSNTRDAAFVTPNVTRGQRLELGNIYCDDAVPANSQREARDKKQMGVLMAYWWAIMKKARDLRWENSRCEADKELAAQRDEAWNLVNRAIGQMFGDKNHNAGRANSEVILAIEHQCWRGRAGVGPLCA